MPLIDAVLKQNDSLYCYTVKRQNALQLGEFCENENNENYYENNLRQKM